MKVEEMSCCSMHDPTRRRGIWFHAPDNHSFIEIRAGREGDDYGILLTEGQTLTRRDIYELMNALDVGRWMLEEQREKEEGTEP